ncbi:MAG TPA: hypothetical protein VMK66_10420, partial [Myxococcales bacterium]|nr:hypothetical protein [Myxococcales bacterium]
MIGWLLVAAALAQAQGGSPRSAAAHAGAAARCESCHSTAGWTRVSFDHEKTGFALEGRHL